MKTKRQQLEAWGFLVGNRTLPVNTDYPGRYMVVEPHDADELPTRDGSNGPWAVVGDDLETLIALGYEFAADTYGTVPGQEPDDADYDDNGNLRAGCDHNV